MSTSPTVDKPLEAYLFRSGVQRAVTLSPDGSNLPLGAAWEREADFGLSVELPVPASVTPEAIIGGLMAHGFFVWNDPDLLPAT